MCELKRVKNLLKKEDPGSDISEISMARRMLRRSGLTSVEQRLVLSAAGAKWDLPAIEGALRLMFSDDHHDDRKRAPKGAGKSSSHARPPYYNKFKGKGKGKSKGKFGKGTYVSETPDDDWLEDDNWDEEWFEW